MGFVQSKAEEDIWMRENDGAYEYIASYVDDLCIFARNPKEITDMLVDRSVQVKRNRTHQLSSRM